MGTAPVPAPHSRGPPFQGPGIGVRVRVRWTPGMADRNHCTCQASQSSYTECMASSRPTSFTHGNCTCQASQSSYTECRASSRPLPSPVGTAPAKPHKAHTQNAGPVLDHSSRSRGMQFPWVKEVGGVENTKQLRHHSECRRCTGSQASAQD